MKRKTFYQAIMAITSGLALTCAIVFASGGFTSLISKANADQQTYNFTLNSSKFATSGLSTEFNTLNPKKFSSEDYVQQTFSGQNSPVINYFLAKKDSNNNLVLAPGGQVFNYSSSAAYNGRITGINSITVNYSGGVLYAQDGDVGSYTVYNKKIAITSGTPLMFASHPNFVMISNSKANTTITSISYSYSCTEAGFMLARMGEIYNGGASNGNAYTLTRSGSSITFNGQSGTISLNSSGTFTMSLNSGAITYSGTVSADYKTLSITNRTGSALEINELNRVFVLDDFEGYSQTGTGLRSGKNVASDLRFAYYGDYGGGNYSSWVTNSSFDSAQSSDYLNLTTAVKRGGSKSATFKGWTGGWTRAWSRETFDMTHHYNFGSGSLLSFWAHGPYTNTACTLNSEKDGKIRVQVYYEPFEITDSNRNSTTYGSGTNDFTIPANSDWTQYTFAINPNKSVYAINIMVDNSTIKSYQNIFIPIDDIQIMKNPVYAPPKIYEETSTKITKSYNGTVSDYTLKVTLGANGDVFAYCGVDMEAQSYSISGNTITIVTTGSIDVPIYGIKTFGTWTGTLSNDKSTITIPKSGVSGSIKSLLSDTVVLNEDSILASGVEGTLSGLENRIKRQVYSDSSWVIDSTNSDRLSISSDYHIEGNNCIRVKEGKCKIICNPSIAGNIGPFDTVGFWVYAPVESRLDISVFTYKTTDATGSSENPKSKIYNNGSSENPGPGWNYFETGLNKKNGYGRSFAILIDKAYTLPIMIDYITYF